MKTHWHWLPATKRDIEKLMAKLNELEAKLTAIDDQLEKATKEILGEIQSLKDQLGNVDIPPGAQASLDKLTALAQALDDINPDVPPPTP